MQEVGESKVCERERESGREGESNRYKLLASVWERQQKGEDSEKHREGEREKATKKK